MKFIRFNNLLAKAAVLTVALFVFIPASSCSGKKFDLPVKTLSITTAGGKTIPVEAEIASKAEERNYGFMNRTRIPDGTGMLFVFEKDQILHFWMKNTPHPLSIAYIDSAGSISDTLDMTPFSETSVSSTRSVRYALEVPRGWFKANGIAPGDSVSLEDGSPLETLR